MTSKRCPSKSGRIPIQGDRLQGSSSGLLMEGTAERRFAVGSALISRFPLAHALCQQAVWAICGELPQPSLNPPELCDLSNAREWR
jgi:hypothetical protein